MSWMCEKCNKEYKDSNALRQHQSVNHPELYKKKHMNKNSHANYQQNLLEKYRNQTEQ